MVSRPIDDYDRISMAQVAIFSLYLLGGIYLCFKHGISRSAGFRFLVILSLARLIGESMRLASISDAQNVDLYIGWAVTNGVGLGPLVLMLIALLSRVFDSINRAGREVLRPLYSRLLQMLMLVATILLIVGGTQSDYSFQGTQPKIEYSNLSHVGLGLMIAAIVLVIGQLALAFLNKSHIAPGETRILPAVAVSLPFVIVRLAYSAVRIFGNKTTDPWVYLGTDVIMEFIVVLIIEVVGFSLDKVPQSQSQAKVDEEVALGGPAKGYSQHR